MLELLLGGRHRLRAQIYQLNERGFPALLDRSIAATAGRGDPTRLLQRQRDGYCSQALTLQQLLLTAEGTPGWGRVESRSARPLVERAWVSHGGRP